jgi:hypothetical protein
MDGRGAVEQINNKNADLPATHYVPQLYREFTLAMIPLHQRDYVWDVRKEQLFIDSIMIGMPISNGILIYIERDGRKWIEDGQNRLHCLIRFYTGLIGWKCMGVETPIMYRDFTEEQKENFNSFTTNMTEWSGATIQQRIMGFSRNNTGGRPLVVGELLHAHAAVSPLIRTARRWFFTPSSPFVSRMVEIWGEHSETSTNTKGASSRYKELGVAVAVTAAILTRNVNNLSKKYSDLEPLLSREFTLAEVDSGALVLDRLLRVYENVTANEPIPTGVNGKTLRKVQWDAASFTGYILCGILHGKELWDDQIDDFDEAFVDALVRHRRRRSEFRIKKDREVLLRTFHYGISNGFSWCRERWVRGINHVFLATDYDDQVVVPEDDDEDSDSTETE